MADPHAHPGHPTARNSLLRRNPLLGGISARIVIFVSLSTFLTASIVSWISIQTIHDHLQSQIDEDFPALLDRRVLRLDEWFETGQIQLAAHVAASAMQGHEDPQDIERLLAGLLRASPKFRQLAWIGPEHQILAGQSDMEMEKALLRASSTRTFTRDVGGISTLRWADGVAPLAQVPLPPVAPMGPRTPVTLVGIYDLAGVEALLESEPNDEPARLFLTDRKGITRATARADGADRGVQGIPLEQLLPSGGPVHEYTRSDGVHVLGSTLPLASLDWLLVVEAPFKQVFSPLLAMLPRILLTDLVIILLFSFLAHKITSAILQPIQALSEGAARVSRGDVEQPLPDPLRNDELGLLTRAFNDMMRQLRSSRNEIELDKLQLTQQNDELQRANEVLAQLSITDGLTKLHNHRYFQDHLTRELKRFSRTGEPLCMILLDLDDFKLLNDRLGHAAGDEALRIIAGRLNESVRESDLLARYGGEEFVVLAPNTSLEGAIALAEKIRMTIESDSQVVDDSMRPVRLTISCGVAEFNGDRKLFFRAADRALYRAKAAGKNCVIAAAPDGSCLL